MKNFKLRFWLILLVIFTCVVSSCVEEEKEGLRSPKPGVGSEVVARIGRNNITLQDLDNDLQLVFYDIAEQKYNLRLARLNALVNGEANFSSKRDDIEIYLKLPEPPRIQLPESSKFIRGNQDAPVTLEMYCSYQSPHCKTIQPVIRRLLEVYKGWVRQTHFDFPLKFHREGIQAASAARCAAVQNKFWEYHDALYVLTPEFDSDTYLQLAKQLQLDIHLFEDCLSSDSPKDSVVGSRDHALDLGLKNVPVIFINGLYLKGVRNFEQYAFWVDKELQSMGIKSKEKYRWKDSETIADRNLPATRLPLMLLGVSESTVEGKSKALIAVKEASAEYFSAGQKISDNILLLRLHSNFAVIESRGGLEKLPLKGREGAEVLLTYTHGQSEELKRRIEQPLGPGTRKLIASSGVLTLGQAWLSRHLEQRQALEAKFTEAELEVEGHHLMRLEGVADNEFFTALGFQENDVLLRVNDSWVHSGQNKLWDALSSGQLIDVVFMRKGLPQRIQYVVEELSYFEKNSNTERE
ncbi:thioredoxin domain-containing protein [Microbulbifer variabilis]|uniref:Thioredoxin domain-containing protein n=1 Tax=Microbulbifer variabilis TaxID=266805 RepID=A0ABY4VDC2_9GAMM|nr:thioredoxin domain-containing protein [Microbulbifer variabilis]USD20417.1 thioredoxin domain-containing protein [Microbulbifer variabilis]